MQTRSAKTAHRVFEFAILVKVVDGSRDHRRLLILFVPLHSLDASVRWLVENELSSESPEWLAHAARHLLDGLSVGTKLFASLYLNWPRTGQGFSGLRAVAREAVGLSGRVVVHRAVRRPISSTDIPYPLGRAPHFRVARCCVAWFIWGNTWRAKPVWYPDRETERERIPGRGCPHSPALAYNLSLRQESLRATRGPENSKSRVVSSAGRAADS